MNLSRCIGQLFIVQPLRDLYRPPKGQIASLDFLRACAILLVVAFHFSRSAYLNLGGAENFFSRLPFVRFGWVGVDLFFVLSGFFIGKQLWREMKERGGVDVKRFVIRRGLRIWPLYFAVFLFVAVRTYSGGGSLPGGGWANIAFLTNYFPQLNIVPGSWSLSTEEQFYILTPLILVLGAARRVPLKWYRWILLGLLVALPLVRALTVWRLTGNVAAPFGENLQLSGLYEPFHTHADGLVIGLLLAHLLVLGGDQFKKGFAGSVFPVLLIAALFYPLFHSILLNFTGCALLFGSCTWFLVVRRRPWLWFLESRLFYVLSRLSFGMYLNHFFLLQPTAYFTVHYLPGGHRAPALQQILGTLLITTASAAIAVVTFCLVEWPFLRLRERLLSRGRHVPTAHQPLLTVAARSMPAECGTRA
jgi:peptidoglycan/LPS O-acetylase OafA/YrhL